MNRARFGDLEVICRAPAGAARPTPLLFVHGAYTAAWCWDENFLPWFAEQGYAAVTMRAIAKECGIAVGTFYNYYPSKDAMLAACLLHDWQTALASAGERTAAAQSAEEAVGAVFDAVRAFQEQNRSIFSDEGARSSAAGALQSRHAQLRAQIAALLEAPCRRFSDAPDAAFLAEFAAESILSWSGTDISFPQLWTLLKRLFIK